MIFLFSIQEGLLTPPALPLANNNKDVVNGNNYTLDPTFFEDANQEALLPPPTLMRQEGDEEILAMVTIDNNNNITSGGMLPPPPLRSTVAATTTTVRRGATGGNNGVRKRATSSTHTSKKVAQAKKSKGVSEPPSEKPLMNEEEDDEAECESNEDRGSGVNMLSCIQFKSIPRPYLYYAYHYLLNPKVLKVTFDKPVTISKCKNSQQANWMKDDEVRFALDSSLLTKNDRKRIRAIEKAMAKNFKFYNKSNFSSILGESGIETLFFTLFLSKRPFYLQDAKTRITEPDDIPNVCRAHIELIFTGIKVPKVKAKGPTDAKFVFEVGQVMLVEVVQHVNGDNDDDDDEGTSSSRQSYNSDVPECIFQAVV